LGIERANHVWAADITDIPIGRGFLYLMAVIDWASRAVLAWRLSNTMDVSFCLAALEEAFARFGEPEIFNIDQGSQFTSAAFTGALAKARVAISMDGRGRCMDNVFIERLWRSLKHEDVYLTGCADGYEARLGIAEWITFYNERRLHQAWHTVRRWRSGSRGSPAPGLRTWRTSCRVAPMPTAAEADAASRCVIQRNTDILTTNRTFPALRTHGLGQVDRAGSPSANAHNHRTCRCYCRIFHSDLATGREPTAAEWNPFYRNQNQVTPVGTIITPTSVRASAGGPPPPSPTTSVFVDPAINTIFFGQPPSAA
jgi:transposase-like protein